ARTLGREALRDYSTHCVFSRDLMAAHASGLLVIGNLDIPLELAGLVLGPSDISNLAERMHEAREIAGEFLAVDGPEYPLLDGEKGEPAAGDFVGRLRLGLAGTGLRVVMNLNSAAPPPGSEAFAEGPLFVADQKAPDHSHRQAVAAAIRDQLLAATTGLPKDQL